MRCGRAMLAAADAIIAAAAFAAVYAPPCRHALRRQAADAIACRVAGAAARAPPPRCCLRGKILCFRASMSVPRRCAPPLLALRRLFVFDAAVAAAFIVGAGATRCQRHLRRRRDADVRAAAAAARYAAARYYSISAAERHAADLIRR